MEFGLLLKTLGKDTGLSTRKFAQKIGVSATYISQVENGRRILKNVDMIEKYAINLEIPVLELIAAYFEFKHTA